MASRPVRLLDAASSGAVGRHGRSLLGPRRSLVCLVDGDDEAAGDGGRGGGGSEGASRLSSDLAAVLTHASDGSNAYDDGALFVRLLVDQLEGVRRSHGTGMTTLGSLTVHLSRVVSELVREAPTARKVQVVRWWRAPEHHSTPSRHPKPGTALPLRHDTARSTQRPTNDTPTRHRPTTRPISGWQGTSKPPRACALRPASGLPCPLYR